MRTAIVMIMLVLGIVGNIYADDRIIEIPNKYVPTILSVIEKITLEDAYYYLSELRKGNDVFMGGIEIKASGKGDIKFDKEILTCSNSHFEKLIHALKADKEVYVYTPFFNRMNTPDKWNRINITPIVQSDIRKLLIFGHVELLNGIVAIHITN
jgi:hypothetical protein